MFGLFNKFAEFVRENGVKANAIGLRMCTINSFVLLSGTQLYMIVGPYSLVKNLQMKRFYLP